MLALAIPVLVEQLLSMLVSLVDTWLTGQFLYVQHLAAIGLMSYVMWLLSSFFGAVGIGATALVSRFVGAGSQRTAIRATNQAILVGCLLAAVATLLAIVGGRWFIDVLRLPSDAAPLAASYLWILIPVIPAIMIEHVGIACLRGAGDTVSGFIVMAVVNIVNVVVSSALVIGIGPLPRLGWEGLAIGTAIGHATGALIVLAMLIRGRAGLRLRLRRLRPDSDLIRRLLRIGLPGGIDSVSVVLCHLWFVSIINTLGTMQAAAHGVAVRIEALAYLPGTAFQVAAATLAGQFLGAGDHSRATRSVLMACAVGGSVMVSAGLLFFFGAELLTSLFLGGQNDLAATTAQRLLQIVAVSMPSLALSIILTGALRGAGDTRWPLVFTFVGFIGVRIPLAYLLAWERIPLPWTDYSIAGFGMGVMGAWYAMVSDIVVRSILVLWRFWHGGWRHVTV